MKQLKITIVGKTALIMHSSTLANPLHPLTKAFKQLNKKKTKTDEDVAKIADLEWEAGVYWNDDVGVYIPGENIEATIVNGAKAFKLGKDFQKYCVVESDYNAIEYGENLTKDELISDFRYRDSRIMRVQQSRVVRTRPRFDNWKTTFYMLYDENNIEVETIRMVLEYAGAYVGCCDGRPKYGKFESFIDEID